MKKNVLIFNSRKKEKLIICIFILLLMSIGCSKKGGEKIIQINPIKYVATIDSDKIGGFGDCFVNEYGIFIIDLAEKNIKNFNFNGELLNVISSKGNGPGELTRPITISDLKNKIITYDDKKRAILEFSYEGKLIREYKIKVSITSIKLINPSSIIGFSNEYYNKKGVYTHREGFSVYDNDMNKKKDIFNIKESSYDPKELDLFHNSNYAMDAKNGRIAYSLNSRKSISFCVMDSTGVELFSKNIPITHVPFSQKSIDSFNELKSDLLKRYPNIKIVDQPKYRLSINSMVYDDQNRLWVAVPTTQKDKFNVLLFDKRGNLLGKFTIKNAFDMFIGGGHLACLKKNKIEGSELTIYQIIK